MAKPNLTIPELSPKDIKRFWSKVATPDENGCELWIGGFRQKYGRFSYGAHDSLRVNRVAYLLHYRIQPGVLSVLHNCPGGDNPACVAKDHLWLGTTMDNAQDAKRKGQLPTGDQHYSRKFPEKLCRGNAHPMRQRPELVLRGERNGAAKLTEQKVREMRRLRSEGYTLKALEIQFGVNDAMVDRICKRKRWTHVE